MKKKRLVGLDYLKVVAVFFVAILHVSAYAWEFTDNPTKEVEVMYHVIQALAYPAIHLFVLVGSFFLIERQKRQLKSVCYIYSQTWIICICGLVIGLLFKLPLEMVSLIQSIFPFSGRAYWFVTEYILLILLSPTLNTLLTTISMRLLRECVIIYTALICIYPTLLGFIGWNQNYSNIGLFVYLYFVVAYLKREDKIIRNKNAGCILWVISFITLIISWVSLQVLGQVVDGIKKYDMYFYQYCSPLVILESVGLFIFFYNVKGEKYYKYICWFVDSSLIIYLIHMHPIWKRMYTPLGILKNIDKNSIFTYLFEIVGISMGIMIVGAIVGRGMNKYACILANRLEKQIKYILNYFIFDMEEKNEIL